MIGLKVTKLGKEFIWTKEHITLDRLEKMRLESDDLADEVIKKLIKSKEETYYEALLKSDHPTCKRFLHSFKVLPQWLNWEKIKAGQALYFRYKPLNSQILMNSSLLGGFSASKVIQVLKCTGYLSNLKFAFHRLLETAQFTMECMSQNQLQPGKVGWTSVLNVRLMHAQARYHVLKMKKYDRSAGIPINQEDLLSTGIVFSLVLVQGLETFGIVLEEGEKLAYLHCWKYIGHLLGLKSEYLHYFDSYENLIKVRESIFYHLYEPSKESSKFVHILLEACTNQPPFYSSYQYNVELARILLGKEWCDQLLLPPTQTLMNKYVWFRIYLRRCILESLYFLFGTRFVHYMETKSKRLNLSLLNRKPKYDFFNLNEGYSNMTLRLNQSNKMYYLGILIFILCLLFLFLLK